MPEPCDFIALTAHVSLLDFEPLRRSMVSVWLSLPPDSSTAFNRVATSFAQSTSTGAAQPPGIKQLVQFSQDVQKAPSTCNGCPKYINNAHRLQPVVSQNCSTSLRSACMRFCLQEPTNVKCLPRTCIQDADINQHKQPSTRP